MKYTCNLLIILVNKKSMIAPFNLDVLIKYSSFKLGNCFYSIRESSRFSVLLQLLKGSLASDINVQSIDCDWRETIVRCHQLLQRHMEHLIVISDEQLQTGRVPTENEIFDHKVDIAMKKM